MRGEGRVQGVSATTTITPATHAPAGAATATHAAPAVTVTLAAVVAAASAAPLPALLLICWPPCLSFYHHWCLCHCTFAYPLAHLLALVQTAAVVGATAAARSPTHPLACLLAPLFVCICPVLALSAVCGTYKYL